MNDAETWSEGALKRLLADGFEISNNIVSGRHTFKAIARRRRFELTKFGVSETFFVFESFSALDLTEFRNFSADAFRFASELAFKDAKERSKRPRHEAVCCFSVADVLTVEDNLCDAIHSNTPTRHFAAFEIPIVFDRSRRQLYFFEKTPLWGFAYYTGFRSQIKKYLLEAT